MSRGLGKTQRTILWVLGQREGWTPLRSLAVFAYHPERFWYEPDQRYYFDFECAESREHTPAEYKATLRALAGLERAGIVEVTTWRDCYDGGHDWSKMVRISVDQNAAPVV